MKNDYKNPGHKKPGLQMEDFFVIFVSLWENLDWKMSLISQEGPLYCQLFSSLLHSGELS